MHEITLRLICTNPEAVKKSLEPDVKNDDVVQTELSVDRNTFVVTIKSTKLNYLKAVMNTYISTVNMLEEVEKNGPR